MLITSWIASSHSGYLCRYPKWIAWVDTFGDLCWSSKNAPLSQHFFALGAAQQICFVKELLVICLSFINLYLHTATLPTSVFKFNWTQSFEWLFIETTVEGNHYTVYSSKHVSRRFPATILSGSLWWAIFLSEIHLQWIIVLDWIFVLTEQNHHDSLQAQGNWPSIVTHVWFPLFRIQNQLPSAIVILVIYNRLFQTPPLFWTDFFLPWFQIDPV